MKDVLLLRWTPAFRFTFPPLLLLLVALVALSGCATVGGPVAAAETVEQRAFALYGTFAVFEETAADIVEDEAVPVEIRRAIQSADSRAKPVVDSMLAAALEANRIRLQVAAGTNTTERLLIVVGQLEGWIARAGPLVDGLVASVRDGS